MEVWEAADTLGVGENQEPTIVGTRGIHLNSDSDEQGPASPSQAAIARAGMDPSQRGGSDITGTDW